MLSFFAVSSKFFYYLVGHERCENSKGDLEYTRSPLLLITLYLILVAGFLKIAS